MDTQDRDENYQVLLNEFDAAVREYEINPNFGNNVRKVKNLYRNYIFAKGSLSVPAEVQGRENDLVKRCGELLND